MPAERPGFDREPSFEERGETPAERPTPDWSGVVIGPSGPPGGQPPGEPPSRQPEGTPREEPSRQERQAGRTLRRASKFVAICFTTAVIGGCSSGVALYAIANSDLLSSAFERMRGEMQERGEELQERFQEDDQERARQDLQELDETALKKDPGELWWDVAGEFAEAAFEAAGIENVGLGVKRIVQDAFKDSIMVRGGSFDLDQVAGFIKTTSGKLDRGYKPNFPVSEQDEQDIREVSEVLDSLD